MIINELDIGILLIVLVNVILGIFRGMVWQITRLAGLVLGLWLGGRLAKPVGRVLQDNVYDFPHPSQEVIAFILVFFVIWLVFAYVTHLSRSVIEKLKLSAYDRTLGGAMGVLKGFVYVFLILLVLQSMFVPEPSEAKTLGAVEYSPIREQQLSDEGFFGHLQSHMERQFQDSALVPVIDGMAKYLKRLFPDSWVERWDDLVHWIQKRTNEIQRKELIDTEQLQDAGAF